MLYWLLAAFHLIVMPVAALHALVCKRDHRTAMGWVGIIVLFPIAGPLLYFVFGINRTRTKAKLFVGRKRPANFFGYERATRLPGKTSPDPLWLDLPNPQMAAVGGRATGSLLVAGNEIQVLIDGEAFFPRLIAAINGANQQVLLSSYLFSSKGIAREVIDAMGEAVARGVTVRVLIDGVGAWYSLLSAKRRLRKVGVQVALFKAPALFPPSLDINLRNHRKIAVIDDIIGFYGGINIDQRHMVQAPKNRHPTQDVHFEARGPVVADLHSVFAKDWYRITRQELPKPEIAADSTGSTTCRVIDDGPDDNLNHLAMTLNGVFSAAAHNILIMVPYFLPNHEMISALQTAALRGVRVKILLPERSNLRFVDWATRNMLWELLIWDVEVYYQPAPFAHTKLIVVDDHYVMGGSANLDNRSLRLNFELGVEMYDAVIAKQVSQHIEEALNKSRPVSLDEVDHRPLWQRARDAVFWLFSSYL